MDTQAIQNVATKINELIELVESTPKDTREIEALLREIMSLYANLFLEI